MICDVIVIPSQTCDGICLLKHPGMHHQVPGSYFDALNGNTKLGKAVRAACDELEHLNSMVKSFI